MPSRAELMVMDARVSLRRVWLVVVTVCVCSAAPRAARAQAVPVFERQPWSSLPEREQKLVAALLKAPDWPIRVFGLLRLERYRGEELAVILRSAVADPAWQVRCFAMRQAQRTGVALEPALLAREDDPRVARAALRHGLAMEPSRMAIGARRLLRTKALDELVLGLELAAALADAPLREEAAKRAAVLILNMNDSVAVLIGRRLAAILGVAPPPADAAAWRRWLGERGHVIALPPPASAPPAPSAPGTPGTPEAVRVTTGVLESPAIVAQMDFETFGRLAEYLDALRQRDLDLAIVMDCTASMLPMLDGVRAGVDNLILFLDDISRTMRLGFIAYYDHDNLEKAPVTRAQPLMPGTGTIRDFLFDVRIIGGTTYPEAVLDGLEACRELEWNRTAARQVVLVGDAPPHDQDAPATLDLLAEMRYAGLIVHAVHVPMERDPDFLRMLGPGRAAVDDRQVQAYNNATARVFQQIAHAGGGRMVTLTRPDDLVPSIMRFAIAEPWWPAFDEFYSLYLRLCR
jgi:hypothetical protein